VVELNLKNNAAFVTLGSDKVDSIVATFGLRGNPD
jgi:hypothetical protein